jgi:hypothetical protein
MLGQAIFCAIVGGAVVIFFKGEPPTPPSSVADVPKEEGFTRSIKDLAKNTPFVILVIAFGIATGSFYAVSLSVGQNE